MSNIEVREEVDVVSIDPLFIERQRNRYASRAVAYVVWLNGLAAIALLIGLTHASLRADQVKGFADAMLVFGAGSVCGLASAFFAYIGRTFRLERPHLIGWRRPHTLACNPCRHCWRSLFHRGFKYVPRGSAA